jgi:hypothetical protein
MHVMGKNIDSWGKDPYIGFDDFEIGVSTDPVTSTKTSALQDNEICLFVRLTEIFAVDRSLPANVKPRVLLLPIALSVNLDLKPVFTVRVWEVYVPRWEGGSEELLSKTDPNMIPTVERDLLSCIKDTIAALPALPALSMPSGSEVKKVAMDEEAQTLPDKTMIEEEKV